MMWYIKIMEYYSSMKKNKVIPPAVQWVDLEIIILSEVSQTEKDKYISLTYDITTERLHFHFICDIIKR